MQEIPIKINRRASDRINMARIDRAITQAGLSVTRRGTMKKYPGCIHWHCKLGKQPGTLEITYWPTQKRAWLKIQQSRASDWIDAIIPQLRHLIED